MSADVLNALTMIPGFFISSARFNSLKGSDTLKRIAVLSFSAVCTQSIMYHMTNHSDPWKTSLYRVDIFAQQMSSILTFLATRRAHDSMTIAVAASLLLFSVSTLKMNLKNEISMVMIQSIYVFISTFHPGRDSRLLWWILTFASRMIGIAAPNPWSHSIFHVIVIKAFHDMWSTW